MSSTLANQIAVIDRQLPDYQVLEQAARAAGLDVLLLSGRGDGVAELAAALAGRSGIIALHILSHGSSGHIQLGNAVLNSTTLNTYAAELAVIRQSLTADGDLLLYGCNTAADEQGQTFISRLAKIVQADVAGSDDLTGAAERGGDWNLELSKGEVETSVLAFVNYGYTLATPTFTLTTTPGGSSVVPGMGLKYNSIDSSTPYIDVTHGDFDGDGDVDLVGATHNTAGQNSSFYLYTNDGSQTFTKSATPILTNLDYAAQVIAGDIDGDGDIDVIVANATDGNNTGKLSVLKNNGNAIFTETTIGTNLTPLWMEIADLDGDGRKDIVFTTSFNPNGKLNWAQQNADGSFTHTVIGDNGGRNSIVVTDFDGDTDKDIVTTDEGADKVYLWTNNGSQSFTRSDLATGFDGSRSVSMGDIDGDGDMDVVVSSTLDDRIRWLENNGSGSFTTRTITTTIDYPLEQHLYDYDGDGDLDIAAAAVFADKFYYLENDGKGNFTLSVFLQTLDGPRHLKAVDLDGDGDRDVLVTSDGSGAGWFETGVIVRGIENSSIVFSSAQDRSLVVADADGGSLTATLSVGAGKGAIAVTTGGGATITNDGTSSVTIAGTIAQVNAALATVTYTPPANESGIAYTALTYSVTDGTTTVTKSVNLNIADTLNAPTISIDNSALAYTENGSAVQIDSAATATDPDAVNNWNGGKLEIQITSNGESADRLTIPDNIVGTLNTNVFELRNGTTVIASLSQSEGTLTGTTKLTITFNANMTDALVQSLVRAIHYDNTSDAPGTNARVIHFSLMDKDGYTVADSKTINVAAVNDNPAMASLPVSVTVTEDAASNLDLSAATLSDPDSASGNITLTITAGAGTLAATTGGSVTVSHSGTSALTLSGTASNIDTFLNTASNIQYTGASNASGNNATTLTLTANDGGNTGSGGGTNVSLGTVNVNITGVADTPIAGFGTGLSFNGTDQYVTMGDGGYNVTTALTMEAWINPSSTTGVGHVIGKWTPSGQTDTLRQSDSYLLAVANGKLSAFFSDNGSTENASSSTASVDLNTWTHVAVVFDNGTAKLYINGALDSTHTVTGITSLHKSGQPLSLGATYTQDATTFFYSGKIDEPRIWTTARTQSEIQDNMHRALLGNEAGLAGYWNLDEGSGTTLVDRSPNANVGTLLNSPTFANTDIALSVTPAEDSAGVAVQTFRGSDADNDGATQTDTLSVKITVLPTNGKLYQTTNGTTSNGTEITATGTAVSHASGKVIYVPNANYNGADSFGYKLNDGTADSSNTVTQNITLTAVADPPVITSNGGNATAAINVAENSTAVTTITATDADAGQTPTFAITGGADQAKFSIVGATGVLTFATAPNFEAPTDLGDTAGNNTYVLEVTANDGNGGTDVQTLTITVTDVDETPPPPPPPPPVTPPVVPDDGDAIPPTVENQTPGLPPANGGTAIAGDGNGDGVVDSTQANVTSVTFRETDTISTEPGAPTTFISLVADSNEGAIDTADTNSAQLTKLEQKDAPADLPSGVDMPLGLISFTATVGLAPLATDGTRVGITETFSLFVDDTLGVNGYWKQNSAGTWVNLASAVHGGQITDVGTKLRLDFQIQDGGEFDADHTVNGVITDPGAAAYLPPSLLDNAPHLPHDGFWF